MAADHSAALSFARPARSHLCSHSDLAGKYGGHDSSMSTNCQTAARVQLQVNTRHLATHHIQAYHQQSLDIPSSQCQKEYHVHDSHLSSTLYKTEVSKHSLSQSPPKVAQPHGVLGKRKAEVLGLEQPKVIRSHLALQEGQVPDGLGTLEVGGEEMNLDSEGDNLGIFTNMPPALPLPANVADFPEISHLPPMKGESSGHDGGTLPLPIPAAASLSKPVDTSRGQKLSRSCKDKQSHHRSCSISTTASGSSISLEKTQAPPVESPQDEEEEQRGGTKLARFIQQVQEWADMLEDIRAARGGTLTFEIFGDEATDCPKLLNILQEIDAKKNWITEQEAKSTRLAKILNLVLKTCDAVDEAQTVRIGRRILDNFAQRFLNRRYPGGSAGSGGN